MVLQNRSDYGFNGYQVPPTPRATRSARKRNNFKKKVEQNQMCAFDLLAIVAGNLLHEKDSPPRYSNTDTPGEKDHCLIVNNALKNEGQDEGKNIKVEARDQGSPARSFIVSELVLQGNEQKYCSKEPSYAPNNLNLGIASAIATPERVERFDAEKLANDKNKLGNETSASKVDLCPLEYREFDHYKLDGETSKIGYDCHESGNVPNGSLADMCSSEDPVVWDGKPLAHVSSDSSTKVPLCGNHNSCSYPPSRDDVNVDSRDDDENSSGCTHPRTTKKFFRPAPRIGDRRIRKILASKYWNLAPRMKDAALSNTDVDWKPRYNKRKNYYKYQRSERLYPFKKRKHFGIGSQSNSEGRIRGEFMRYSPQNGSTGDAAGSCSKMHGGNGASSPVADQQNSFQSRDSHVKLRIKSFKVPELFIEVPESATVGMLKRMVMDAVTAILGGGLRVGVLLQGKKVRDDNVTLQQTGISHYNQVDALGFSLEPNSSQSPSLCPVDSPFLLSRDTLQPLTRYPPAEGLVHETACAASSDAEVSNLVESDHDSAPSFTDVSMDKSTTDSKALVPLKEMNVDALAIAPPHRKSKRSEAVQRRIRRPFSVAEVEALVQAVEKLGTGRWRDVKVRAFENAKHRTYVDLKDKWKTLVHTARISPQQRRGEPVPQELLDRVLTAHAYWSHHQAKQQQHEACLLL
ncbi:telomere repeat-binding protein 2 [Euphorbia lathyris]|uniref:telomere repeat-binding protein 2 n=1 Tax=Euphorbia lathyris TaxID=212925 RepID=UPI003313DF42